MTTLFEVDALLAGENAGYEVLHSECTLAKPESETADPSATLRFGRDDKG